MQRRFTIIQGGLADRPARPAASARTSSWRVVLRRPLEVAPAEGDAWRALADRQDRPDPFADPDYLLAAARNNARGADIAFAFAFAAVPHGTETLRAVLPLVLGHAVWGGSAIRLWHPALATRPVEPVLDAGTEDAAVAAILTHLRTVRPAASLRLGRVAAEGRLACALGAAAGLAVTSHPQAVIPPARFVDVARQEPPQEIERIVAASAMRDAVERFLLLDAERARRPLIADPAEASLVRVAMRLFAKRGAACVELGRRDGTVVCGAIRLGTGPDRVLWRAVAMSEVAPTPIARADLDIMLDEGAVAAPHRFSLVAP